MQRVRCVCISHLHGDHYFGLIGMLNSMHLLGRNSELIIICPERLKHVLQVQFEAGGGRLGFPVRYIFLDEIKNPPLEANLVLDDKYAEVYAFPLKHRIPCYGFLIKEKQKPRSMRREAIQEFKIPYTEIEAIRHGRDFTDEKGAVIPNHLLTYPAPAPKSYAYCTDTKPLEGLAEIVRGVDLLYHEATFMETEAQRAIETYHSTASQAASIALKAGVKCLLIGHYSARYKTLDGLLEEARVVFENTRLAIEGEEIVI